jgi:hypothetical protein
MPRGVIVVGMNHHQRLTLVVKGGKMLNDDGVGARIANEDRSITSAFGAKRVSPDCRVSPEENISTQSWWIGPVSGP